MSEADTIDPSLRSPVTIQSLEDDLRALGVTPGMNLLLHSSLSSLGWVCGGPVAVILALQNVLDESGTLVMPTHSGDLSDPAQWENPPVPDFWWETIRQTMPAFDPEMTPTRMMGAIPECFRKERESIRSTHPQVSFAAWGYLKDTIIDNHSLDFGLGNHSPLGRIYDVDGWVLLLGVNHDVNTSLHLAEYRAEFPGKKEIDHGAPIIVNGHREWKHFRDLDLETSDFKSIGQDFLEDRKSMVRSEFVRSAKAQLFRQRDLVDFAVDWMEKNRKQKP